MRKLITCSALLALATCLSAGAAFGDDCGQFNITIKPAETELDPDDYGFLADMFGVAPFEWCWSQRVVGTIKGEYALCGSFADLYMLDPLGLGIGPELYGNPGIIHTRKGDLYTMSYGLSVWDGDVFVAFGGLTRIVGGTEAYGGAWGYTTDAPKKYPPTFWMQSRGYLCVPD
jgi:hypothetical protein